MNILSLIGKPHRLPLQIIDPYLEVELELETQKQEREISHQIESLDHPVIFAFYDILAMEIQLRELEDSFHDIQSLVD